MGSLRNPVGPLPASIYWRRRAVAFAVVALLALLAVWAVAVNRGGGGEGGDQRGQADAGGGTGGRGPADDITPGPTGSGPAITERPGGRDEVDGGAGSGGDGGASGDGGKGGGDGGSGALAGTSGSLTGGDGVPPGPGTPVCGRSEVTITLRSVENSYGPGDTPKLRLTLENRGDGDCRVDLGRTATVLTLTDSDDDRVWSSADCPSGTGSAYVKVPAGGESTHVLSWNRERSEPGCATDGPGRAGADTYVAEAEVDGLRAARTSFVLTKD